MATNMETEGLHGLNNGVELFEKVDEEEEEDAKLDTGSVFTISGVAVLADVVFV